MSKKKINSDSAMYTKFNDGQIELYMGVDTHTVGAVFPFWIQRASIHMDY